MWRMHVNIDSIEATERVCFYRFLNFAEMFCFVLFHLICRPSWTVANVVHQTTGEDESDQLKRKKAIQMWFGDSRKGDFLVVKLPKLRIQWGRRCRICCWHFRFLVAMLCCNQLGKHSPSRYRHQYLVRSKMVARTTDSGSPLASWDRNIEAENCNRKRHRLCLTFTNSSFK